MSTHTIPPSHTKRGRVLHPATQAEKDHVHDFCGAFIAYAQATLAVYKRMKEADWPEATRKHAEQQRQWIKLCRYMQGMNRRRKLVLPHLGTIQALPSNGQEVT